MRGGELSAAARVAKASHSRALQISMVEEILAAAPGAKKAVTYIKQFNLGESFLGVVASSASGRRANRQRRLQLQRARRTGTNEPPPQSGLEGGGGARNNM